MVKKKLSYRNKRKSKLRKNTKRLKWRKALSRKKTKRLKKRGGAGDGTLKAIDAVSDGIGGVNVNLNGNIERVSDKDKFNENIDNFIESFFNIIQKDGWTQGTLWSPNATESRFESYEHVGRNVVRDFDPTPNEELARTKSPIAQDPINRVNLKEFILKNVSKLDKDKFNKAYIHVHSRK